MLPDLKQLITLQELENSSTASRSKLDGLPARQDALDVRLERSAAHVSGAHQRFDEHKADRQAQEKDLAAVQTRLSRFKDQLMEVKTNKEYQAMQLEITGGEAEINRLEDHVLERMLEADELTSNVQTAEQQHADEQSMVESERAGLELERTELEKRIEQLEAERAERTSGLSAPALSLFATVAKHRNGVAVVEARDGRCSSCQVRLRPQLFNDIRRNDTLIQCESCQRILYFVVNPSIPSAGAAG